MMARFYYVHVNTYQRFSLIINNEGICSGLVNNIYYLAHLYCVSTGFVTLPSPWPRTKYILLHLLSHKIKL